MRSSERILLRAAQLRACADQAALALGENDSFFRACGNRISIDIRCKKKIAVPPKKNYTVVMAATPIPVRLTLSQIERIDTAATRLGISRTGVIKMCLAAFLQQFERDGLGMLPPNWADILRDQDGRTHRYGPTGGGHRIAGDNIAIGNRGPVTQKKKSTGTSTSSARTQKTASAAEVGNKRGRRRKS